MKKDDMSKDSAKHNKKTKTKQDKMMKKDDSKKDNMKHDDNMKSDDSMKKN